MVASVSARMTLSRLCAGRSALFLRATRNREGGRRKEHETSEQEDIRPEHHSRCSQSYGPPWWSSAEWAKKEREQESARE